MKPQGTSKLLTASMVGLVLLASAASAVAQTSPAQPNDVRKALNQAAQAAPTAPPSPKAPQAKAATPATPATPAKPTTPAPAKAAQAPSKPAPVKAAAPQTQAKTPVPAPASTPTKAVGKPAVQSSAKPAPAAPPNPSKPELKQVAEHSTVARRDPFDPLINKEKDTGGPQTPLPAGKPGLVIATLRVDGIVRGPGGMIAVVSNPQMRVYFLREGDHLYDGDVEHITMEGVAFHQTGKDAFGKAVEREATKRLYPTPGEQQ